MSTLLNLTDLRRRIRYRPRVDIHQSSSWLGWTAPLNKWLRWSERSRQRADLRDLDEHLLKDIGITRQQALDEANRPFWD
jgi:uncharacterized protein YjiS (DUF1127 family)